MEQLNSLVYVSSATRTASADDLRHLLERAQERNRRCAVTGVLLFDAGNFMQYIEGPRAGLLEVYGHIQRDPLHSGIIELSFETLESRLFEGWAMGARTSRDTQVSEAWLQDQVLEQRLQALPGFSSAAATLLHGFWQRAQRRSLGSSQP